ncbi:MAG: hypothetical protein V2A66_04110 [Pseudomonadota bacterium]
MKEKRHWLWHLWDMLPAPSITNFAALALLFTAIFLLDHFGQGLRPTPAAKSNSTINKAAWKALTGIGGEKNAQMPPVTITPPAAPAPVEFMPQPPKQEIAPVDNAAQTAKEAAVETKPGKEAKEEKPVAKSISRRNPVSHAKVAALPDARDIPVEELDSENARQGYLAANRGKSKTGKRKAIIEKPKAEPSAAADDYFIPFEKRR